MTFTFVLYFCLLFEVQEYTGQSFYNPHWVKFDYCIRGSPSCSGAGCGGRAGDCIADNYIQCDLCMASGLGTGTGLNQPANDPNVISIYHWEDERQVNYSSLEDCENRVKPYDPSFDSNLPRFAGDTMHGKGPGEIGRTWLGSHDDFGFSYFFWGGNVSWLNNTFGQFNMSKGYYIVVYYRCPGNIVTQLAFVEDPAPHVCVSNVKTCPSSNDPSFVTSIVCYPDGPLTATQSPTLAQPPPPTPMPTAAPTVQPTPPTDSPTGNPTSAPTNQPTTQAPTGRPTTPSPTRKPTAAPTSAPTRRPTRMPTHAPTRVPTKMPTRRPTKAPTSAPTKRPSNAPTHVPTRRPSNAPTKVPTKPHPTVPPPPTFAPTPFPTPFPTSLPTLQPTAEMTGQPTASPTPQPTGEPTPQPTAEPTKTPTPAPDVNLVNMSRDFNASCTPPNHFNQILATNKGIYDTSQYFVVLSAGSATVEMETITFHLTFQSNFTLTSGQQDQIDMHFEKFLQDNYDATKQCCNVGVLKGMGEVLTWTWEMMKKRVNFVTTTYSVSKSYNSDDLTLAIAAPLGGFFAALAALVALLAVFLVIRRQSTLYNEEFDGMLGHAAEGGRYAQLEPEEQ